MNKEEMQLQSDQSCKCPFCDEPICPDPTDNKYTCGTHGKLKIQRVDCVGLYCPVPVMRAKEEIDLLEKNMLMELVADDPASAEDIPRWAKVAGHTLIQMYKKGDEYHFLIRKDKEDD